MEPSIPAADDAPGRLHFSGRCYTTSDSFAPKQPRCCFSAKSSLSRSVRAWRSGSDWALLVLYMPVSIGALSYAGTPHIGQSWDDVVFETFRHRGKVFAMYWAMGLGVVGTVIDMYIFVVPLPVLSKLQLSVRRRIQLFAVFLTGFLCV